MANTDDPRHRYRKARERLNDAVEAGDVAERDADAILEVLDAPDAENPAYVFQVDGSTEISRPGSKG